jgi:hypothetical protein
MKMVFGFCLLLLLASCFNTDSNNKTEQLNQRIIRLEQRIDSLISASNTNSMGLSNTNRPNAVSYSTVRESDRCRATTKKGTQCKRKAKNNSYCWQHGG